MTPYMGKTGKKTAFAVVSVNAGVDRVVRLSAPLTVGGMNRAAAVEHCAGSKGANAALLLSHLGADLVYIAATGGEAAALCNGFTERAGIPCRFVKTAAGVRTNLKLISPDGVATECNERGGPLTPAECEAFLSAVTETPASTYLFCGSLPAGVPEDFYADLARAVRAGQPDSTVVLDASGPNLLAAMEKGPPDLIKPNRRELADLFSRPEPKGAAEVLSLCRLCRGRYPDTALLCTLGADGAAYFGASGSFLVKHPAAEHPHLTVGAGDTFLAAFLAAREEKKSLPEALGFAAAAAMVHIELPAGEMPDPARILEQQKRVCVQELT